MLISFTKYDISVVKELIKKYELYPKIIIEEFDIVKDLLEYFDFSQEEINNLRKILMIIED
ncbi:hypothetical protein YN1_5550 [Nanoarchaeota archaeon]